MLLSASRVQGATLPTEHARRVSRLQGNTLTQRQAGAAGDGGASEHDL